MTRRAEHVQLAYDLAVASPSGFTRADLAAHVGVNARAAVSRVIQDLRDRLAVDQINLVCEPAGYGQPWTYRLVGNAIDARWWRANRERDMERRVNTVLSVSESLVNATPGDTREGKRARIVARGLKRLVEDLELLDL